MEDLMIENILDSMTDSLVVIGRQGEVVYTNRITEQILGCDLETLKAEGLGIVFFTREENYEFNQIFVDAVREKALRSYSEVQYHHPDGSWKRLAATTCYLADPDKKNGSLIGFIAIFKDITEIYQLRLREKSLLEARQKAADEKIESLQKLAAGVAHEIRNPIVTIGGFASRLLKTKNVPEIVWDHSERILTNAKKLERVVDEVQRYCVIKPEIWVETSLTEITQSCIMKFSESAALKNIRINFRSDSQHQSIVCDPILLKHAIGCLLENAVYFSLEGSLIDLVATGNQDSIIIEVIDFGHGVDKDDMAYVFNPFFSTRADRPGMGLPTAQRIVNQHMGSIELISGYKTGIIARITLPRHNLAD